LRWVNSKGRKSLFALLASLVESTKPQRGRSVAPLDHFITPDQNYASESAAGGSYERKCD
jgi:hypothetical protein